MRKARRSKVSSSKPAARTGPAPRSRGKTKGKGSMIIRGNKGRRLSEKEVAKSSMRKSGGNAWRFFVRPGEERDFIILDEAPDVYMYEHNLKDPKTGRWNINLGCVKETHNCPVCEEYGESYYALYFTVIELFDEPDQYGNEFARRLLLVKPKQHGIFHRMYDRLHSKGGSLRGALIHTVRDGDKDPKIGNDIQYEETIPEKELKEYVRVFEDRDGKEREEDCSVVYDYDELFPAVTVEQLAAYVGGDHDSVGNREAASRELDDDDGYIEEGEDDELYGEGESDEDSEGRSRPRTRSRRKASSSSDKGSRSGKARRRVKEPEEEELEEEEDLEEEELEEEELAEEEYEEEDPEEEEELEEEEEEEEPVSRRRPAVSRKKKARKTKVARSKVRGRRTR